MSVSQPSPAVPGDAVRRRRIITAATVAGVLLIALVLWLALKGDDSSDEASTAVPAKIVTPAELKQIASGLGFPLYWAGPLKGARIEYTQTASNRYFVRYLTGDAQAGDPRRRFVTVGTYPQDDAYKTLVSASKVPTATSAKTRSGALVVTDSRRPTSVYFGFPGAKFQVEVYSPSPTRARRLVLNGTVRRVI